MKNINERCPFGTECERKKCEYRFKESECDYYYANNTEDIAADGVAVDILDYFDDEGEERKLEYIDIDLIHPHPDNPRKNVGDVSELAESIKHSGIMQNLTVVPYEGEYRVIIGHRRLAASKVAELSEVPCVVVEMSEKEQIATMLSENMQRVDLTTAEEVQGVQMLLDLGDSISDIAKITGFSESKVRQRAKLGELPREAFLKSQGGTLEDYIKITKIKDEGKREALLRKIGTDDFNLMYKRAVQEQKQAEERQKWIDLFESFAYKTPYSPSLKYLSIQYLDYNDPEEYVIPEDADDVRYYYEVNGSYIRLYRDYTDEEKESRAEENRQRVQREQERDRKRNRLIHLDEEFSELRKDFVKKYTGDKAHAYTLVQFLIDYLIESESYYGFERNIKIFHSLLGFDEGEENVRQSDEYLRILCTKPQRILLSFVAAQIEKELKSGTWDWAMRYQQNDTLDKYIKLLRRCGYRPAEEEQQFYDGTHEAYVKDDEE